MLRLLYAVLLGIVGAGVVHICVLLMLPAFSERDAWSSLAEAADYYKAVRIDADDSSSPIVKAVDPLFHAAACRFDLDDGPVHVRAPGNVPFWSVSIYNREGQNVYSFNDRATDRGTLDFVILTSSQLIEVRKAVPEDFRRSIFVQVPIGEGIVVVRDFVPDPTWDATASQFLARTACSNE
ncbi:DUF1254 domain-containing protein [Mesorhizobium marinum]|uniref:DUF1254 domain-containing protein n=1 Tax=Mesorhizobium marinum TaxID=3228790 RepID=A0ABV3R0H3_9HYPH